MLFIRVALRRVPSMLRQDSRVKLRRHSLVASPRFALSDCDHDDEQKFKYWVLPCEKSKIVSEESYLATRSKCLTYFVTSHLTAPETNIGR